MGAISTTAKTTSSSVVTWEGAADPDQLANDNKMRAEQLAHYLNEVARVRQSVHIHVAPVAGTSVDVQAPDIRLETEDDTGDVVHVLIAGAGAEPRRIATAVPWADLPVRITRLIKTYSVERCGKDTFGTWAHNLSDHDLRERLGLAAAE